MPHLKCIFTILMLMCVLRGLEGYRSARPNDWQAAYDDENNKFYEDSERLDRSLSEAGDPSQEVAIAGGNGNVNVNGNGNGNGNGAGCNGGDDDLAKSCKTGAKCSIASLNRSEGKMTASGFAQKAAQEAKAASDAQVPAAEAASFQAKCELAGKAIESAKGAEAVLAGKQEILEQARLELIEAEAEVARLSAAMRCTQENAELAVRAAHELQAELNHVKNLIREATKNVASMQCVAKGAQQELVEKTNILKAAKFRAENLNRQLAEAKADFDKTKMSAYRAVCAAVEAKQKAQRPRRMSWLYSGDDSFDFDDMR